MPNLTFALIPAFLLTCFVFGFMPGVVLRQVVRLYPKSHARRDEIVAEGYEVPTWERPAWVFAQLELALHEGLPERNRDRKRRAIEQQLREDTIDSDAWSAPGYWLSDQDTKSINRVVAWSEDCATLDVPKVTIWLPGCTELHPVEIPMRTFERHFGHGCNHAVALIQ